MCIICEKGKRLATLYQILLRLEREGNRDTDTYKYVQDKVSELKQEMDTIEENLGALTEWQQENDLFYPTIDDEKQAKQN